MSDSMGIKNKEALLYSGAIDKFKNLVDSNTKKIGSFDSNENDVNSYSYQIKNEINVVIAEYKKIIKLESNVTNSNDYTKFKSNLDNFNNICNKSIVKIIEIINRIRDDYIRCINNFSSYIVFNNTDYENNYMDSLLNLIIKFTTMKSVHHEYKITNEFESDYDKLESHEKDYNICELLRLYQYKLNYLSKDNKTEASSVNSNDYDNSIANVLLDSSKNIQKNNISLLKSIKNLFVNIASNYSRTFGGINSISVILDDSDNNFYCPTYLNTDFTVDFENSEVKKSLSLMSNYYDGLYSSVKNVLSDSNFSTTAYYKVAALMYGYVFYRRMTVFSADQNANLMETVNIPSMSSIESRPFDEYKICICGALPINYQELIQKLNFNYKVNIRDAYIKTANIMYYYSAIINTLVNEKYAANANAKICQFYNSSEASSVCEYNIIDFKPILKDYQQIINQEISSYHKYIFQNTSDKNKITESSLNKFTDNNLLVGNMTRSSKILNNTVVNSHSFDEIINAIDPQKGSWVLTFIIGLIVGILSVAGSILFVIKKNGTEVSTEDELKSKKKTIKVWYIVCLIGLILSVFILAASLIVLVNISKNSPANKIRVEILFTAIFIIISFGYLIFFNWYYLNDKVEIKLVVKTPEQPTDTTNSTTPEQTN